MWNWRGNVYVTVCLIDYRMAPLWRHLISTGLNAKFIALVTSPESVRAHDKCPIRAKEIRPRIWMLVSVRGNLWICIKVSRLEFSFSPEVYCIPSKSCEYLYIVLQSLPWNDHFATICERLYVCITLNWIKSHNIHDNVECNAYNYSRGLTEFRRSGLCFLSVRSKQDLTSGKVHQVKFADRREVGFSGRLPLSVCLWWILTDICKSGKSRTEHLTSPMDGLNHHSEELIRMQHRDERSAWLTGATEVFLVKWSSNPKSDLLMREVTSAWPT